MLHYAIFRAICSAMFLATCPSGDEIKVEGVFLLGDCNSEKKKTNFASIFNRKFQKVESSLSIDDTLM